MREFKFSTSYRREPEPTIYLVTAKDECRVRELALLHLQQIPGRDYVEVWEDGVMLFRVDRTGPKQDESAR